jgi:hypothetical protein
MTAKIKNSGCKEFPYYLVMIGKKEFCATNSNENAQKIIELLTIAERKNKAIGVDAFCDRLDNIFEMGNPTKAQIIDAYNKSVAERMPTEKDAIRYAADYATELDASEEPHTDIEKMDTFLHGTRWFRSRMEEKK